MSPLASRITLRPSPRPRLLFPFMLPPSPSHAAASPFFCSLCPPPGPRLPGLLQHSAPSTGPPTAASFLSPTLLLPSGAPSSAPAPRSWCTRGSGCRRRWGSTVASRHCPPTRRCWRTRCGGRAGVVGGGWGAARSPALLLHACLPLRPARRSAPGKRAPTGRAGWGGAGWCCVAPIFLLSCPPPGRAKRPRACRQHAAAGGAMLLPFSSSLVLPTSL